MKMSKEEHEKYSKVIDLATTAIILIMRPEPDSFCSVADIQNHAKFQELLPETDLTPLRVRQGIERAIARLIKDAVLIESIGESSITGRKTTVYNFNPDAKYVRKETVALMPTVEVVVETKRSEADEVAMQSMQEKINLQNTLLSEYRDAAVAMFDDAHRFLDIRKTTWKNMKTVLLKHDEKLNIKEIF